MAPRDSKKLKDSEKSLDDRVHALERESPFIELYLNRWLLPQERDAIRVSPPAIPEEGRPEGT